MEPARNAEYKSRAYWDARFEAEAEHEWLGGFAQLRGPIMDALAPLLGTPAQVLVLGCGNSALSAELAAAQPEWTVVSVDFSAAVIARMRARHPELEWIEDDMTALRSLAEGRFDAVVDKAGMDALVTDEGDPWRPSASAVRDVDATVAAVGRVLKRAGGRFVQVSFQQPHFRRKHLERAMAADTARQWAPVRVAEVDVGLGYFVFSSQVCA